MESIESNPQLKIETPQGRTYGECVMDEIASIKMINGEFRATLHIKEKPKRLKREDALIYYTQKLRNVWGELK
ncbi:MAG: hypothetical protein ACYDD5_13465 [Sulfuricurvum sp.]|jgi:uncharacterized protein YaiI (UPF0178 family)|nr:MAG: hypothetical protein B7Y17_03485 [Sulfuricurvum sp. 24-42-5]OZA02239.1 MAG: hypothetical protein B7X89_10425 [Sulfuricurvum sp. 17-40-25]